MIGFPWLPLALGLALVLSNGAWAIRHYRAETAHTVALNAEQVRTRETQTAFDAYKLQVEQSISDQASATARQNAEALDRLSEAQAEIDRLRQSVGAATKARDDLSTRLTRELNDAPPEDKALLGVAVLAYLQRVREAQSAARAADNPPPR